MKTGTRETGDFCWINILTPDPDRAREFFGALLGWTYDDIPGMGHAMKVGGRDIGGIFDLNGPNTPPGTAPILGVMVKVESADATVEKVNALGGKAKPAFDIGNSGRMAVCHDPNGAEFDIWEPKTMLGTDAEASHHGAPSWFETTTTDTGRAAAFYTDLFGWKAEVMPMPGFDYTVLKRGEESIAGIMPILPHMGDRKSQWSTYFTVDEADATAKLAVELGANLCVPPQDISGIGRFCGITSPQGITFYVITYAR